MFEWGVPNGLMWESNDTQSRVPDISSICLSDLKKQARGLIGHSNAGLCGMDLSGLLGNLKQVWLNKGGVATIIPLKQLKKLCPVVYNSTRNWGAFICRTNDSDVVLKNKGKGMPSYLDLREFKAEAVLSLAPEAALGPSCRLCEGIWKDSSSVKLKKSKRLVRHKRCWGIPPAATFWEWYVATRSLTVP